jgi:hypothetical protein
VAAKRPQPIRENVVKTMAISVSDALVTSLFNAFDMNKLYSSRNSVTPKMYPKQGICPKSSVMCDGHARRKDRWPGKGSG